MNPFGPLPQPSVHPNQTAWRELSGSMKTYHVCFAFHAECCTDAHLCFQNMEEMSFEDAAKEARRRAEKLGWTVGDIAEVKFCRF